MYLLAGTVYDTPEVPTDLNFSSLNSFISSYSKLWGKRRPIAAIVFLMILSDNE